MFKENIAGYRKFYWSCLNHLTLILTHIIQIDLLLWNQRKKGHNLDLIILQTSHDLFCC